jgi:hypothetical protein
MPMGITRVSELLKRAPIIVLFRDEFGRRLVEDDGQEVEPFEIGVQLDLELEAFAPRAADHVGDATDGDVLVVLIEEHFHVTISDEEVGQVAFASINALADFVAETQSALSPLSK